VRRLAVAAALVAVGVGVMLYTRSRPQGPHFTARRLRGIELLPAVLAA
jgi:hypothetical protein